MSNRRVLIVDDESDIREIAQLSMEIGGWEVLLARDGAEAIATAIATASAHPLDVILLDVMMPEVDGPETLQRLRAQPKTRTVPVVFLTAKAQVSEQRHLYDLGACGVIAKPFDPMRLSDLVTEILATAAHHD